MNNGLGVRLLVSVYVCGLCVVAGSAHAHPPLPSSEMVGGQVSTPVFMSPTTPLTLFVPRRWTAMGLGFPGHDPRAVADWLRGLEVLAGTEFVQSGTLFLRGVPMNQSSQVRKSFEDLVLSPLQSRELQLRVASVPDRLADPDAEISRLRDAWQRLRYFFPSRERDLQRPLADEVRSGMGATALLEIPNVIFLFSSQPAGLALTMTTTHSGILASYQIWAKSMVNWLLRSGFRTPALQNSELFTKQLLLSVPFVVNFNVLSNFNNIMSYAATHGWDAAAAAFPAEFGYFLTTQGLTIVLQTLFYQHVMTNGFGRWMNEQPTEARSERARALRPWVQAPIGALNAVVVTAAAVNWGGTVIGLPGLDINTGHLALAGMTAMMAAMFRHYPGALDALTGLNTMPVSQPLPERSQGVCESLFMRATE